MKIGFDNEKIPNHAGQNTHQTAYWGIRRQAAYLEFGGKLLTTTTPPGSCPALHPDSKLRMLLQMADQAEILIAINAADIEKEQGPPTWASISTTRDVPA